MSTIGPVTDQYIDSIIKSAGVANPNLNKTQGTGMRELIKKLRDRLEQEIAANTGGFISHTFAELKELVDTNALLPGQSYILTDYRTIYIQPVTSIIRTDATSERLLLIAASENTFFTTVKSLDYQDDVLEYDFTKDQLTDPNTNESQDRPGWIIYRRDANDNAAFFDWRNIEFRRWAIDATDMTDWQQGGTYSKNSLVKSGERVYGVAVDVTNEVASNIDDSPENYLFLLETTAYCLPNSSVALGQFNVSASATEFSDLPAIDPASAQRTRILSLSANYTDSLPNVVIVNTTDNCQIAAQVFDCHIENSQSIDIAGGSNGIIIRSGNTINIGANNQQVYSNNSDHVTTGSGNSQLIVSQSSLICTGINSANNVVSGSTDVTLTRSSDNTIVNCYSIRLRQLTNSQLTNCSNIQVEENNSNCIFKNVFNATIDKGCNNNILTYCDNVTFGMNCWWNNFTNAYNLTLESNCTGNSNDPTNSASVGSVHLKFGAYSNLLSGSIVDIIIGQLSGLNHINGNNIHISDSCSRNTINNSYNVKIGLVCSDNVIGSGNADIVLHGNNRQNVILDNCSSLEFGLGASQYNIGNNVWNSYFRKTTGETVPDNARDLVPWSVDSGGSPGTGFIPGNWTDILSKSLDIENETSALQFKIDGQGQQLIVYLSGQFNIQADFSAGSITLGSVGASAQPASQVSKYMLIYDQLSGTQQGYILTVDITGEIKITPDSGNVITGPGVIYFIDLFYKPTIPVFSFTKTQSFTKNDCTSPLVGTSLPYSKIYNSYISIQDAENLAEADTANFDTAGQTQANAQGSCISEPFTHDVIFHVDNQLVNYFNESTFSTESNDILTHLAVVVLIDQDNTVRTSVPVPPGIYEWLQKDVNTAWNIGIAIQQTTQNVSPKSVVRNSANEVSGKTDLGPVSGTFGSAYRWLMDPVNVSEDADITIVVTDDTDSETPLLLKNEFPDAPYFNSFNQLSSVLTKTIPNAEQNFLPSPDKWTKEFRWVTSSWDNFNIRTSGNTGFSPICDLYARRAGTDILQSQFYDKSDVAFQEGDVMVIKKAAGEPISGYRLKITDDRTHSTEPLPVMIQVTFNFTYGIMEPGDAIYGYDDYPDQDIFAIIYSRAIRLNTSARYNIFAVYDEAVITYIDSPYLQWAIRTTSNGGVRELSIRDITDGTTPPVMLLMNSATANTDGSTITLLFNKEMSDPTGKEADFIVHQYLADPIPITNISLAPLDNTQIILVLSALLDPSIVNTYISYGPANGAISSIDGFKLFRFTDANVIGS